MCIYCTTNNYRKIYEHHHGPIPVDDLGRTYEIHHRDGDHHNNHPSNLQCVSVQEHYDIHYAQEDWSACFCIAKRLKLTKEQISDLIRAHNRNRTGSNNPFWGRTHSEFSKSLMSAANKGRKMSEEAKRKMSQAHMGRTTWNKGIPMTDAMKDKLRQNAVKTNIKTWQVIYPSGVSHIVTDRVQFCKDHNLHYGAVSKWTRQGKPYMGYLFKEIKTIPSEKPSDLQL
jgi:hypothetical protein